MSRNPWSREASAIAIRADGRRVPTRVDLVDGADVSLLDSLKALGLRLLALSPAPGREPGGTRRTTAASDDGP
jgi:hypothetical protein